MEHPQKVDPMLRYEVMKKSEGLAVLLSFLFMGIGQLYCGAVGKGLVWLGVGAFLALIVLVTLGIGGIIWFPFWVFNLVDAYNTAKRYNLRLLESIGGAA